MNLATSDALTGVSNLRAFLEIGNHVLALPPRSAHSLQLLVVKIARIEEFYRKHGLAGDAAVCGNECCGVSAGGCGDGLSGVSAFYVRTGTGPHTPLETVVEATLVGLGWLPPAAVPSQSGSGSTALLAKR
jgi:hypothetical protein